MKKILLGAAAATLLITGCAQNELLDGGIATPNDGKIYFAATSGSAKTKAAVGNPINSSADLQKVGEFHVQGYVDGTGNAYVNANPKFNGVSWEYADEPYWPNAPIDFYAYANWTATPTINPTNGITAGDITIAPDALGTGGHKDLLVAGTFGATKEVRTLLTFKHALTQIVFKAGNINPSKIVAKIGGVRIVNVGSMGNMAFKKEATPTVKWGVPTTIDTKTAIVPNGTTPAPAERRAAYVVQGIGSTVPTGFTAPDLSATPNDYAKYPRIQTAVETDNNALMLLPQNFNAWDTNSGKQATATDEHGAYIELDALVYQTGLDITQAGLTNDEAKKYIYAGSVTDAGAANAAFSYGKIYIPVSSLESEAGQWVAGKRVNYIITFGDSNSGSGGGGYDINGDPILVPIRFRATVEDWVETNVPLLTATFEATSSSITHKFIDGYTNQLLNDIKAAPAPKLYNAEIKLKGTLSANIGITAGSLDVAHSNIITGPAVAPTAANVNFQSLLGGAGSSTFLNAKFRPGSTLVYDFSGVTNLNQANKAKIEVPNGWIGQSITGTTLGTIVFSASTITLDGTITGVKLTKIATNGDVLGSTEVANLFSGYSYICQAGYIEDNLAAVELNENHATFFNSFTNTITVSNPMPTTPTAYFFSSEMLAKMENAAFDDSKLTINMSAVTIATGRSIQTVVPKGWIITKNTTTYYPGDLVAINDASPANEKTWVYTKQLGTPGQTVEWKNELELEHWLTQPKTFSNFMFYYDNTDGLITLDLDANLYVGSTTKWSAIDGKGTAFIFFKNPVGAVKAAANAAANGEWGWDYIGRMLNYSDATNGQSKVDINYLTTAELKIQLASATDGAKYYAIADAPASFLNDNWLVQGLTAAGQKIMVYLDGLAGTNITAQNGWHYSANTRYASFEMPALATWNAVTSVSSLTAGHALYVDATTADVDFAGTVTSASLTTGQKIYVVLVGTHTAANLPAGWVLNGKAVTFTK